CHPSGVNVGIIGREETGLNRDRPRADKSSDVARQRTDVKERGRPAAMKFATLGSALSVACIFTSGAVCGVMGMKLVAPTWLEPSTASAAPISSVSNQPAPAAAARTLPAPATPPGNVPATAS